MPGYILYVSSYKVLTTVPNPVGKVIFSSHSGYFPSPIFKSSSENCSAVLSPFKCTRIFLVKENFSILGHKYEDLMHAAISLARVPQGTIGRVCRKSPASSTVTPPINKFEFLRSFRQLFKASKPFL